MKELFAFVLPLMLGSLVAPLSRRLSFALGALDIPGERHIHQSITPRGGGLVLAAAALPSALLLLGGTPLAGAAVSVGALLFALGLTDDIISLSPLGKLVAEALFFSLVPLLGIAPTSLRLTPALSLPLSPLFSFLFTVFFLLLVTNGVNMIDGMDTLSSGSALISCCGFMASAVFTGKGEALLLSLLLLGAIGGFLPYNRHPASLFLGDGGALLLGFLLGLLGLSCFGGELPLPLLLLLLLLPICDPFLSFARRFLKGRNPFMADKSHLHHRLLRRGIPYRRVVRLLHLLSLLGVVLALLFSAVFF